MMTATDTGAALRPSENGLRAIDRGIVRVGVRDSQTGGPQVFGHFAVFNRWTEIDSWYEGNFLERIAPGAFKKTMREQRDSVRLLFQHGADPDIGDKPIGSLTELREDDIGAYYEADLFGGLPALVMDGLRADQYGASFRFRALREEFVQDPGPSDYNPKGLPERTLKELSVPEFGPVTFPAYAEATAGVRSVTDDFIDELIMRDPERIAQMIEARSTTRAAAPSEEAAEREALTVSDERREQDTAQAPGHRPTPQRTYLTRHKETKPWQLP